MIEILSNQLFRCVLEFCQFDKISKTHLNNYALVMAGVCDTGPVLNLAEILRFMSVKKANNAGMCETVMVLL